MSWVMCHRQAELVRYWGDACGCVRGEGWGLEEGGVSLLLRRLRGRSRQFAARLYTRERVNG
jgi:hypothetical protein